MLLRDYLQDELAGWQSGLSQSWQTFFDDVSLDFDAIPAGFQTKTTGLIPPRRAASGKAGVAEVLKAFTDVAPEFVRVVVIGQDPYPQRGQATGRAFEDGLFERWDGRVAKSVKALRRAAVSSRLDRPELLIAKTMPWRKLVKEVAGVPVPCIEPMGEWFDHMADQGVMFVNASMTLTHYVRGGSPEDRMPVGIASYGVAEFLDQFLEKPAPRFRVF